MFFCFVPGLTFVILLFITLLIWLGSNNREWTNKLCKQSKCCLFSWRSCVVAVSLFGPTMLVSLIFFLFISLCIHFQNGGDFSNNYNNNKKTLFMHFLFYADVQFFCLSWIVQFDVMIFRNRVNRWCWPVGAQLEGHNDWEEHMKTAHSATESRDFPETRWVDWPLRNWSLDWTLDIHCFTLVCLPFYCHCLIKQNWKGKYRYI